LGELNLKALALEGITSSYLYEDGSMKDCLLTKENYIETDYGKWLIQYSAGTERRKYTKSLSFYRSGQVKSISFETPMWVNTPMGSYEAELVTFYENGSINRVFPLNGQLNGFWSEEDEYNLSKPCSFKVLDQEISCRVIGFRFYESGQLRSITLWPKERLHFNTDINIRIGFTLTESGKLQSFEPALPTSLVTRIGEIVAYDSEALGINADKNSVVFDNKGAIYTLKTETTTIIVKKNKRQIHQFSPKLVKSQAEENQLVIMPLQIVFEKDSTKIYDGIWHEFMNSEYEIVTKTLSALEF